jgi:oligopeptidase B
MLRPPLAKREPHQLKIHGNTFIDDYFWLRNKDSKDVMSYLNAENDYAEEMMADTKSLRELLFQEMKGRIKETDQSAPMKHGDYIYYYRTVEGKDYRIHCRKHMTMNAPEVIILDENDVAKGKNYMSIGSLKISPDHRRLAYSVDFTGGTTYDIRIVGLDSGRIIDTVQQVGGQIEWDWDSNAIFYSKLDNIHRDYAISVHVVGSKSLEDEVLYEEPDTSFYVVLQKSSDKKYIFLKIGSYGSETIEVRYIELERPDRRLDTFLARREGVETDVQHHHGYFYFSTNL